VKTGSGNGKIRLDVLDNDTIESTGGLPLEKPFSGGPFYTVNKGPVVPTATLHDTNPTDAESVKFVVTFPDEVGSIAVSDFVPVTTGTLRDVTITEVKGAGETYKVTVSTGYGEGKLSLAFGEDTQIMDPNGDPLDYSVLESDSYLIERQNPTVNKITRMDENPTSSSSVDFSVVFSKPVIDVSLIDFSLTITGDLTGAVVASLTGSGEMYVVSVDTGSGSGTIRLDVVDNDTIEDLDGNSFDTPYSSGEKYKIEREVLDVTVKAEDEQDEVGKFVFEVIFSKPVKGFDEKNIVISGISESSQVKVFGSGAVYFVEVSGLSGNEKINVEIIPSAIQDILGNYVDVDFEFEVFDMEMIEKALAPIAWSAKIMGSLMWVIPVSGGVVIAAGFFLLRRKKSA
jgi:hypothetical protein